MLKHIHSGPVSGQNRSARGLNGPQPLNVSTVSNTSVTPSSTKHMNGGPPRLLSSFITPLPSVSSNSNNNNNNHNNATNNNNNSTTNNNILSSTTVNINKDRLGAREALTSLGLLCLVSLLLALLSLIFLLKISPGGREPPPPTVGLAVEGYDIIYDVTLALCALSLSLNLCCLLVCAIQFLFAVKLVRAPATTGRGNKYLQKSSVSRVCAVGGFFISIPIFLTGIILYTFTQFHSTPAIVTSILIGVGIVFCGGAMVHNVFVWQREKTISVRQSPPMNLNLTLSPQISTISQPTQYLHQNGHANHMGLNHSHAHNHNHTPVTQLTPVTPLSGNHSHISFNHSYLPSYGGIRAATATPPTPKVNALLGRDASSVSPGMPVNLNATVLDISNVTATNSPHELSTLV